MAKERKYRIGVWWNNYRCFSTRTFEVEGRRRDLDQKAMDYAEEFKKSLEPPTEITFISELRGDKTTRLVYTPGIDDE